MKLIANDPKIAAKRDIKIKERWAKPSELEKHRHTATNSKQIQHIETGKIYESISDAVRNLPVSKQTIKNNLSGKFNSRKNMNFRYL